MIDYFALAVAHALIAIAVYRMAGNPALDDDDLSDSGTNDTARSAVSPVSTGVNTATGEASR
ncbi:hypothetical protein GRI44_11665 [Altererythrobacter confluentis]|uniref:Uncharacterized protein n=1 Tax=Allopontixanthobacter confluentis TaxID=1849021 RepID=A0A6L7GHK4_9SPHN|nr:hypothetical protein [Allopontixanthobacter confluentis]MXP15407.1 hypothetical protein [Allopontixanthobacter confluentis]